MIARGFNCYEDERLADSYARLQFPGTYHLAYRDLPALFAEHVLGRRALDFGCGAGRSTRFLRGLGMSVVGVDASPAMIERARTLDPGGEYRLVAKDGLAAVGGGFDLVLSAFTFDNIPTEEEKVASLVGLAAALAPRGRIVNLVSSPAIYTHEWASFSTRDFPENWSARKGDVVRTVITELDDLRPVDDVLWPDDAYRGTYARAGLSVVAMHEPLGRPDEPYPWVNETRVAPWAIYVLARRPTSAHVASDAGVAG